MASDRPPSKPTTAVQTDVVTDERLSNVQGAE